MMKKLSGAAAVLAALMMLFVAGCEQSSGGGESSGGGDGGATSKNRVNVTWTFQDCTDNNVVKGALSSDGAAVAEFKADGTWSMGSLASGTYPDVDASKNGTTFKATVTKTVLGPNTGSIPDADISISNDVLTVKINLSSINFGEATVTFIRN
ncbi:MAG TPA: hypothetical protein IAA30_08065 [Candidatus Treponema faecavium]|nr:hypothetical protein [Candidatus Treponema faecavium]